MYKKANTLGLLGMLLLVGLFFSSCTQQKEPASTADFQFAPVQWGMTVEEAKEALQRSDDEIQEEEPLEGGGCCLTVTHKSAVFGEVPEQVLLSFEDYSAFGIDKERLTRVRVVYPGTEEKGELALKKNIEEIYGTPAKEIHWMEGGAGGVPPTASKKILEQEHKYSWYSTQTLQTGLTGEAEKRLREQYAAGDAVWSDDGNWQIKKECTYLTSLTFDSSPNNLQKRASGQDQKYVEFDGTYACLVNLLGQTESK